MRIIVNMKLLIFGATSRVEHKPVNNNMHSWLRKQFRNDIIDESSELNVQLLISFVLPIREKIEPRNFVFFKLDRFSLVVHVLE